MTKTEHDTSARIIQTAHDLFMQFGIKSVSMDDIADRLGMSKKTLYKYYVNKETIVVEVVDRVLSQSRQICEAGSKKSQNALHELMLSLEHMYDLFNHMNPSVLFDLYKYYPKAYLLFKKHKEEFLLNMIHVNLKRGIKESLYRSDIKVDILSKFRMESIMIPFHPEFLKGLKVGLVEVAHEIAHHFIHGIVTTKGQALIAGYRLKKVK